MKLLRPKTFIIDLDGTLCKIVSYTEYGSAPPLLDRIGKVRELKKQGHRIVIYTSRYEDDREITLKWLQDKDVEYDELVMGKPHGDYYIDDSMVSLGDWMKTKYETIQKYRAIGWEAYLADIDRLCQLIPKDIDRICGVPRKGLIPATLVALKLRRNMVTLDSVSRSDLIVEDDINTGSGLATLRKYGTKIAAVYVSPGLSGEIDYFSRTIDFERLDRDRICLLYPWELLLIPDDFNAENIQDFRGYVIQSFYGNKLPDGGDR